MFNTGTTGFMLLATSLVMLMTPGLAFFYGGLAGKRNILGIMMQSFVSMGITTISDTVIGDILDQNMILLHLVIDPLGRFGPILQYFLF